MLRTVVTLALSFLIAPVALAERITVDPPMKLVTFRSDRSEVSGQLVAYDEQSFDVTSAKGETKTVRWDELDAKSVLQVHTRLFTKATGEQWLALGEQLLTFRDGKAPAEKAFATAIKLNPSLKAQADSARQRAAAAAATPAPVETPTEPERPTRRRGRETELEPAPTTMESEPDPGSPAASGAGPQNVGQVQADFWGPQPEGAQATAVGKLKAFAAETKQRVNHDIVPYETKYFLLYSDLKGREAQRWQAELDRMYARLSELFAIPKGENIWRGKALVFIFSQERDYMKFCQTMHGAMLEGSAGVCYQMGDGYVHIAFYRQPDERTFAHVLVHESVHGFLHRYKSPARIPTWANEGLAEVIAYELIPERGKQQQLMRFARDQIRNRGSLGDGFFSEDHIEAWQYPVAQTLCEFMIRENMKGYVNFINGIKDGMKWEQSLEQKYGAPRERLVPAYAESLGVKPQQLQGQ